MVGLLVETEPASLDLLRLLRPSTEQWQFWSEVKDFLEVCGLVSKLEYERPTGTEPAKELFETSSKVILPRLSEECSVFFRDVPFQVGHAVLADRVGWVKDDEIEAFVFVWEIAEVLDFVRLDQIAAVRLAAEAGIQYLELCFLVN